MLQMVFAPISMREFCLAIAVTETNKSKSGQHKQMSLNEWGTVMSSSLFLDLKNECTHQTEVV